MENSKIQWRRFILFTGIIWLLQAGYSTLSNGFYQEFSGQDVRWLAITIYNFAFAFAWWLCTPVIFRIILWAIKKKHTIFRLITVFVLSAILIASIQRLINIVISYNVIYYTEAVDPTLLKWSNFLGINFLRHVVNGILIYTVIVGILYGYLYYIRSKKLKSKQSILEGKLSELKLENLKYQFQPHFLFNSLQAVSTLMHRDIETADMALGDIGELLRHSIKTLDTELITLGEELYFLRKYLNIQEMRFGDKLKNLMEVNDSYLKMMIPTFILQPLVENSIKHNLEKYGRPMEIIIKAKLDSDFLTLECLDRVEGKKTELSSVKPGVGLENLRLRLHALYGDRPLLEYGYTEDSRFLVTIRIPTESKTIEV